MSQTKNVISLPDSTTVKLSARHKTFADEYLRTYSPTKAAEKAQYSGNSMSQIAYQLMRREDVKTYIQAHMDNRKAVMEAVPFDVIVGELTEVALDPERDMKERMKASDLLMKWQQNNKWTQKDNAQVDKYVEALQSDENIWEGE